MQRSVVFALVIALALAAGVVAYSVFGGGSQSGSSAAAPTSERQDPATPAPRREENVAPITPEAPRNVVDAPAPAPAVEPSRDSNPAATAPATLQGRFVDSSGQPLARVHVEVRFPVVEADSDELGKFSIVLQSESKSRGVDLSARRDGYANFKLSVIARAGETTELGDLVLNAGGAISGRVVDENGAAVAGAELRVTNADVSPQGVAYSGPWNWLADGKSDARGDFRVTGVPAGAARVWGGGENKVWDASPPVTVPERGEVFDVVLTVKQVDPQDTIGVLVIDPAGAPVPEAMLVFRYEAGNSSGSSTTQADKNGRYTMHLPHRVVHTVQASDPENRYRASPAVATKPGTLDLVLQLGENKTIAIVVREKKGGAAIESFRCDVRDSDFGGRYDGVAQHAGGRMEVLVPVGEFRVEVDAPGYQIATLGPYQPDHAPAEIAFDLEPLPGVRGIVKASGEPARGAQVALCKQIEPKHFCVVNGFAARSQGAEVEGTSDDKGEFVLTLRNPGKFYLRAELDGWAPGEIGPFEIDPSVGAKDFVIELVHGGTVEGRAATRVDESPAGIVIGASRGDGQGTTTRTDANGKFRFTRLTPGRWWIGRHDQEISPNSTTSSSGSRETDPPEIEWNCTVRDGETTWVDVPAPAEDPVRIRGKLALGGKPATGWEVTISPRPDDSNATRHAVLDASGRFTAACPRAGECNLWFVGPDEALTISAPATLKLGDNEWKLDLPVGSLSGRVVSVPAGDSPNITWVWFKDDVVVNGPLTIDPSGEFDCPRVPAGHIRFQRYVPSQGAQLLKELDLDSGASLHIEL